ncbi:MAG: transcriptional regulator [Cyanobacteria bacterium J06638_20]
MINTFPPRPIGSEEELVATQARINNLLDSKPLSQDDRDYLKILGMLVYEYEESHEPIPILRGAELLNALLEEANLQSEQIASLFGSEANLAAILQKQQDLTIKQIHTLAQFFHIKPELFLSQPTPNGLGEDE